MFLHKDPIPRVHADEQQNNEYVNGDLSSLPQKYRSLFLIQVLGERTLVDGNNLLNFTLHLPQRGKVMELNKMLI